MRTTFVTGPPEKRLNQIEKILERMLRRVNKTVVGVIPNIPFMGYCENPRSDGLVSRGIIPGPCKIKRVCIAIERFDIEKLPIRFSVSVGISNAKAMKLFELSENVYVADVDFDVTQGTILTLKVENPETVSGISYGILMEMAYNSSSHEQFLIDEIERLAESADATD